MGKKNKKKQQPREEEIDLERVVDTTMHNGIECSICYTLLSEPRSCKEGHNYCKNCINKWLTTNTSCPLCKCYLDQTLLEKNRFLVDYLSKLVIKCQYSYEKLDGQWIEYDHLCKFTGEREKLEQHEAECPFQLIKCKFNNNCKFFRKGEMSAHLLVCDYRIEKCKGCKKGFRLNKLNDHMNNCDFVDVECECKLKIQRRHLPKHKDNDCGETPICCPFYSPQCSFTILRKEAQFHILECNYRRVICEACNIKVAFIELEEHTEECEFVEVYCLLCEDMFQRKNHENHLLKECCELEIPCPLGNDICKLMIKRKDIDLHLKDAMVDHLVAKTEIYQNRNTELEKQIQLFQNEVKTNNQRNADLEKNIKMLENNDLQNQSQIYSLFNIIKSLNNKTQKVEDNGLQNQSQIDPLLNITRSLEKKIQMLEDNGRQNQSQIDSLLNITRSLEKKIQMLEDNGRQNQSQIDSLLNIINNKTQEVEDNSRRNHSQIISLEKNIQMLEDNGRKNQRQISSLFNIIKSLNIDSLLNIINNKTQEVEGIVRDNYSQIIELERRIKVVDNSLQNQSQTRSNLVKFLLDNYFIKYEWETSLDRDLFGIKRKIVQFTISDIKFQAWLSLDNVNSVLLCLKLLELNFEKINIGVTAKLRIGHKESYLSDSALQLTKLNPGGSLNFQISYDPGYLTKISIESIQIKFLTL